MALIISEPQTRKLIDMQTALKLVDEMFRDRAAGKVRSVPRRRLKGQRKTAQHDGGMAPGHGLDLPARLRRSVEHDHALHGRTGAIQAIIDMGYLEQPAHRRSHRCRRQVSRAGSTAKSLGVIGPGWQATFQVEAVAKPAPSSKSSSMAARPSAAKISSSR